MAKIVEELIVIKVSQLVKESETGSRAVTDELASTIETVVQELVPRATIEVVVDKK